MSLLKPGRKFMLFAGEWMDEDGIARPTLMVRVVAFNRQVVAERFLLDSGADRTLFSAALLWQLHWPLEALQAPPVNLSGIGGTSHYVLLSTALELPRVDGVSFRLRAEFAAFTDPAATEMSLLGRDVLDLFDVIISRKRNDICLLYPIHRYIVMED